MGSVTSAAYGHTVGKSLAIAFLGDGARDADTTRELSILGKRVRAIVLPDAPLDPDNERLRA